MLVTMGPRVSPVSAVHRIGILDIRIFNTDRHAGNLLVRKLNSDDGTRFSEVELIPIDHGRCLPEDLEDPYFEWIPLAPSFIPFSEDELEYIEKLDPFEDADMLKNESPDDTRGLFTGFNPLHGFLKRSRC
ncbi:putative 1-phosphatidylinositol 4-kinase [Helianthus annuus]|nr:putative 1-phosphatidylinositol 4-kinase [Helianthus annuus]